MKSTAQVVLFLTGCIFVVAGIVWLGYIVVSAVDSSWLCAHQWKAC